MVSHDGDILADTEYFKNRIRSDNGVLEMMYEIFGLAQKNMVLARYICRNSANYCIRCGEKRILHI